MKIAIINGPNLNLIGRREPEIYGNVSLEEYLRGMAERYADVDFVFFQSNHEGDLIDEIQRVGFQCDGILLNAGGYTHTSVAIADAIRAVDAPVVEVHISDIENREPFRRVSMIRDACVAVVFGHGLKSYDIALEALMKEITRI